MQSSVSCDVMSHPEDVASFQVGKYRADFCLSRKWFSSVKKCKLKIYF